MFRSVQKACGLVLAAAQLQAAIAKDACQCDGADFFCNGEVHFYDCSKTEAAKGCTGGSSCDCMDKSCRSSAALLSRQPPECAAQCSEDATYHDVCGNFDDQNSFCGYYSVWYCVRTTGNCTSDALPTMDACEKKCDAKARGKEDGKATFLECLETCAVKVAPAVAAAVPAAASAAPAAAAAPIASEPAVTNETCQCDDAGDYFCHGKIHFYDCGKTEVAKACAGGSSCDCMERSCRSSAALLSRQAPECASNCSEDATFYDVCGNFDDEHDFCGYWSVWYCVRTTASCTSDALPTMEACEKKCDAETRGKEDGKADFLQCMMPCELSSRGTQFLV